MPFPAELSELAIAGLIALSFFTSLLSATFSLGGGTLLIGVMAMLLPAPVVVPVHGCVQLGSNAGRAFMQRAHTQWKLVQWLVLGAAAGSLLGGQFALLAPDRWLTTAIGGFVLLTAWTPQPTALVGSRLLQFIGGAAVSALGMVVGAAGPLIAAFLRGLPDRRQLIATHATLVAFQHVFKILVFIALGFAFGQYLLLILLMTASGFAGTAVGSRLLARVPEQVFRLAFRIILSLVAIGLIHRGLFPDD
jgi:uncharacterized membrane protein YfcA